MLKTYSPRRLYIGSPSTSVATVLFTATRVTEVRSIRWSCDSTSTPTVTLWAVPKGGAADATNGLVTAHALVANSSGDLIGNGVNALVLLPGDSLRGTSGTTGTVLAVSGDESTANSNN
jgi:hypothetical protein